MSIYLLAPRLYDPEESRSARVAGVRARRPPCPAQPLGTLVLMATPFDPHSSRLLQLVTRGLDDSPAYRAAKGMTTMQRVAEMQDSPILKLARGETVMQRFTEIQESPVMRASEAMPPGTGSLAVSRRYWRRSASQALLSG
jgi:hypothetical protein